MSQIVQQLTFVGPAVVFFTTIMIIPFIVGIYYSFTDWNGISDSVNWVGLDNFKKIFSGEENFKRSFWFTFQFTITNVILVNLVGLILALLLTKPLKAKGFYRTVLFIPNVIGGLLLGYIFQFIFTRGMPAIGQMTGIEFLQTPWLGTPDTAFWGIIVMSVWQSAGYMMIIYIAGITNVPNELVEAARIDGANEWKVIQTITLPLLMPSFTICLFLSINSSFKAFDQILSLTGGGPFNSTEVVAMDIYLEAFTRSNMGLGSAKAMIFFIIIAIITLTQVWLTKRKEVEA
ncbi:carbohydrate ABC transporter permease [Lederbergia ruris]|uniref:carbohydrate ABC transporter permease n=1 Tax=Lederbergia ruris TaxID=217495 RepID=UPI0039A25075